MRNLLLCILFFFPLALNAQDIPAWNADDIKAHTSSRDTVYIVNFWATWCAPCVHELPEFNALNEYYAGKPVKVILISLDFREDYPAKLGLFLQRKQITPQVAWLSETDPGIFIPKIDNSWQGSIPATLIIAPGRQFRQFMEGITTEKKVKKIVDPLMK